MKQVDVTTREQWRAWLEKNQTRAAEVWLVFHKKHTGRASLPYDEAVEEALCFGWIDSIIKRVDDARYVMKFTPRRRRSAWSESNKARARRMVREGRMTEAGLVLVKEAKASGAWGRKREAGGGRALRIPPELGALLEKHPQAKGKYLSIAPSYRRQYAGWVGAAKKEETRQRRAEEVVRKIERGEPLGLK